MTKAYVSKANLNRLSKENPSVKHIVFDNLKEELSKDMAELLLDKLKENIAFATDITEDDENICYQLTVEIKTGLRDHHECDTTRIRDNK